MSQQPVLPHGAPIHGHDNLPVRPVEWLFGRDSDLSSIHLSLKAEMAVLLHGPSGIGKTALAAALASGYAELPGGVLWLELINDSLRSLLSRIARGYGADITAVGDLGDQIGTVRSLLQQNRPLIVLDGELNDNVAREFVQECAVGMPLLLTCSHLIPGLWTPHALFPLRPDNAQAMLIHLAGPSFGTDMAEVGRLSKVLNGFPLAIVVAGYQLGTGKVTPGDFMDRLPALPAGETNPIMSALMAAYRLLPATLQGMVLLLGASFAGGASEELLSVVGGAPENVIQGVMRQLVARGFAAERMVYGQPYFVIHERIQSFAQAFLRGKKQLEAMQTRHLRGLLTYVEQHTGDNTSVHHDRLAAEAMTILVAGAYAAQHQQTDQLEKLVEMLQPATAESFVTARRFRPEFDWLQLLVEQPELAESGLLAMPEPEIEEVPPVDILEEFAPTMPEVEPVLAETPAPAIIEPAVDVQEQDTVAAQPIFDLEGRLQPAVSAITEEGPEAVARYDDVLLAVEADGDVDDELAALEALATLSLDQENYEDVLKYVEKGMALAEEHDNPQQEGHMLMLLGDLQVTLGRDDGAELAYKEAVDALLPTEAWLDVGMTLDKLGLLFLDQKRYQEAIAVLEQAVSIFEREEHSDYLITVLDRIGDAYTGLLQWDQALEYYSRALQLSQQIGNNKSAFEQLAELGYVLEMSGDRDGALLYYQQALDLAFKLDDTEQLGYTLLTLARLLVDDAAQLNRVVQLLEAASERLPEDTEIQRLLGRARTRQERLSRAGVPLIPADDSLRDYVKAAIG